MPLREELIGFIERLKTHQRTEIDRISDLWAREIRRVEMWLEAMDATGVEPSYDLIGTIADKIPQHGVSRQEILLMRIDNCMNNLMAAQAEPIPERALRFWKSRVSELQVLRTEVEKTPMADADPEIASKLEWLEDLEWMASDKI